MRNWTVRRTLKDRALSERTSRLRRLEVIRTERTISDYVEWAVSKKLGLMLSASPIQEGYDATDQSGRKYQIKYRMDTGSYAGFEGIKPGEFDYLLCVFLDEDSYRINSAYKVPRSIVEKHTPTFKRGNSFTWNKSSASERGVGRVI